MKNLAFYILGLFIFLSSGSALGKKIVIVTKPAKAHTNFTIHKPIIKKFKKKKKVKKKKKIIHVIDYPVYATDKAKVNFTVKGGHPPKKLKKIKRIKRVIKKKLLNSSVNSPANSSVKKVPNNFAERASVKKFIAKMSTKHNLDKNELNDLFAQFSTSKKVLNSISRPYERATWNKYRKIFLTQKRIKEGVSFWTENIKALRKAERKYGVPPHIITAIMGVETYYGKYQGDYPVIESLLTLSFDYPKRSAFFKKELEQFLLLTKEKDLDPLALRGSYAGAMGIPQFISSSYRNYAVNLKGRKGKKVDIINNVNTAIASVANYFKSHGWNQDKPFVYKATVKGKAYKSLVSKKAELPKYKLQFLNKNKIKTAHNLNMNDKFSLIELNLGKKKEHWLGGNNFYVITRYNHSYNYAMAVYQLGMEIKRLKEKTDGIKG